MIARPHLIFLLFKICLVVVSYYSWALLLRHLSCIGGWLLLSCYKSVVIAHNGQSVPSHIITVTI